MRKLFGLFVVVALVGLLISGMLSAGVKRLDRWQGTATVTIDGADSTGWLSTDKFRLTNVTNDQKYDGFVMEVYAPNFGEADSTVDGEGLVDTVQWVVKAQLGRRVVELYRDSSVLPDTGYFEYWQLLPDEGDTSATGTYLYTGFRPGLLYDHIWLEYRVADTAGTNGALTVVLEWKAVFWEDR